MDLPEKEKALKVAKDYINLLKQEKKELIEFRNILETENKSVRNELRQVKLDLILSKERAKDIEKALKHKNAMTIGERELIRKDEVVQQLKKSLSELKAENLKLKRDKDSLIQKLHSAGGA